MLVTGQHKAPFTYGRLGVDWDRLARARGWLARSEDYDRQINANLKTTLEALVGVTGIDDVLTIVEKKSKHVNIYLTNTHAQ
jgi:hypothetical protein